MSLEEWNSTSSVRVSGKTPTQIVTGVVTGVCPVRGDFDVDVFDALIILVLLDGLVLFNPAETNKVDGRMLDVSLVEEFNNLGTKCQSADYCASRRS